MGIYSPGGLLVYVLDSVLYK